MQDGNLFSPPQALRSIEKDTASLGFDMASEPKTGALLRALSTSKPGGAFLELGTGTGLSAAWILDGMDANSSLLSLDNDESAQSIAAKHLGQDSRLTLQCVDGESWLDEDRTERFDLIFADAWPGKFSKLEEALHLLAAGGMYVIDDLLPQENWPENHAPRVPTLIQHLEGMKGFKTVVMSWASGLMMVVRQ